MCYDLSNLFFTFKSFSTLKQFLISMGFVFALAVAFFACKKDTVNSATETQELLSPEDRAMVDYLVSTGYDAKNISVSKDGCVVEGCMYMDRETLVSMMSGAMDSMHTHDEAQDRQRAVAYTAAVKSDKVNTIKYFIHSSVNNCIGSGDWKTAVSTSVQNWNNMSYCRVSFVEVLQQSLADLIVCSDESSNASFGLPNEQQNVQATYGATFPSVMASAAFPSSGNAGKFVSLDRTEVNTLTMKTRCFMHELSHVLGYHHANQSSGNPLHGTPNPDVSSAIMCQGGTGTVFGAGDTRAARLLYPDYLAIPSSYNALADGTGKVKITVATPSTVLPRYWIKVQRSNMNGGLLQSYWVESDATTLYVTGISPGTYKFRICATNYRRDLESSYTDYKTVTIL
jgi:hypothetical protein